MSTSVAPAAPPTRAALAAPPTRAALAAPPTRAALAAPPTRAALAVSRGMGMPGASAGGHSEAAAAPPGHPRAGSAARTPTRRQRRPDARASPTIGARDHVSETLEPLVSAYPYGL